MYSISISEETDSMLKASVNILFLSLYVYNLTVCLNVNVQPPPRSATFFRGD